MKKPQWFQEYISGNLWAGFSLSYHAENIGTGYVWQVHPALSMQVLFDEWGTILVELCESHGDAIKHRTMAYELAGITMRDLPVIVHLVDSCLTEWDAVIAERYPATGWEQYNIPEDICRSAVARKNLQPLSTGGNVDYVERDLTEGPGDSYLRLILRDQGDAGSPDSLSSPCTVVLCLSESWENSIGFNFDEAAQGLDFMAGFTSADLSGFTATKEGQ